MRTKQLLLRVYTFSFKYVYCFHQYIQKHVIKIKTDKNQYIKLWELDITSKADKDKNLKLLDLNFEKQLEKRISDYIQNNLCKKCH